MHHKFIFIFIIILYTASYILSQTSDPQFEKNLQWLKKYNTPESSAAVEYLAEAGSKSVENLSRLLTALDDSSTIVRENIASILGKISPSSDKIIKTLIRHFADEDVFVRGRAIEAIVNIGEQASDGLIKALQDKNDEIRLGAAIALSKMTYENTSVFPALVIALKDTNPEVRWCAAITLGQNNSKASAAVPELQKLLNDDDRDVRWAAYISLSRINKSALNIIHDHTEIIAHIKDVTPRLMEELKVPGVSISIIKDKKIAWSESFGFSDAGKKTKVKNETLFEACSMTKPVFAYIVLKLVEQGKLGLDEPLSNYLPYPFIASDNKYSSGITARMILTHTSGMPNWRKTGDERDAPLPLYFKPGTKFQYSGEGMFYLQKVIEHIIKEPLESYAKRNLFDKLGLKSTSLVWTEILDPQIATGHDISGNCKKRSRYYHANAAYTLYTTAEDYASIIIAMMSPDNKSEFLLSEKMTYEMLSHQVRADIREVIDRPGRALGLTAFRGLGWGIDSTITEDYAYHSGANQTGFKCYSQFNLAEGSGIVIMTNGDNGSEFWQKIISVVGDL